MAQDDYRTRGSDEAPLVLTIYSDFECPYCRNFALAALPAVLAEFTETGRLRVTYVFFPLAQIHQNAVATAKAAHCAGRAGRFWAYHDYLYARQPEWSGPAQPDSLWIAYAGNLGLDPDDFAVCLNSAAALAAVEDDLRQAIGAGATGTPTIVLGDRSLTGLTSYEELRRRILEAIGATAGK
ncbi:MAG: thioredoxin domain-containing protein [Gemmatimonadota bacterium]|nr:MAG: thioredoxin domain-containing protein [Gemmatimonadota bacterium]